MFFSWLQELKENKTFPEYSVQKIRLWVHENLDPYDHMWLNYQRTHVGGMSQRTTSIGEALHASMKSGYDKVFASMGVDRSATLMMDKAERKGKRVANLNAQQVQRKNLWSTLGT